MSNNSISEQIEKLAQKYAPQLHFLSYRAPQVTVERKRTRYYSILQLDAVSKMYAFEKSSAMEWYHHTLSLAEETIASEPAQNSAQYKKTIQQDIEKIQKYGVQEHDAIIPIYTMEYLIEHDQPVSKRYLCADTLRTAVSLTWQKLIVHEREFLKYAGYRKVQDAVNNTALQDVLRYHTVEDVKNAIQECYTAYDDALQKEFDSAVQSLSSPFAIYDVFNKYAFVLPVHEATLRRFTTEYILQPFFEFSKAEKTMPLHWTLLMHCDVEEYPAYIAQHVEQSLDQLRSM